MIKELCALCGFDWMCLCRVDVFIVNFPHMHQLNVTAT
jgi:hypothetical protein